jgi:hypothetical protein
MAAAPSIDRGPAPAAVDAALTEPTRAELRAYGRNKLKRLKLQREAAALGQSEDDFEQRVHAYLKARGTRASIVHGFPLSIEDKQVAVAWKREFTRLAGVQAAVALAASQPTKEVVIIGNAETKARSKSA